MAGVESESINQEIISIPQIQSSILTSFLDDSNVELCCDDDDERLRVVIQSLEAEINPIHLKKDQGSYNHEQLVFDEELISSAPPEDVLDYISWMDVEILPSSPCSSSSSSSNGDVCDDEELSLYDQVSVDDELNMRYMIEYVAAVSEDYSSQIPLDMEMEMEMVTEEQIYSSLWQENYDLQSCTSHY